MKSRHLKVIGLMLLVGAVMCAVVYAHKHKGKKTCLPDAVKAAINTSYPKAEIEEVEAECEGLKVYEVELEQNDQELELTLAKDGTIIEVETKVCMESLPKAVADAITKVAEGAKIKKVEKEVTHAELKFVKLDDPKTTYEAKIIKDGKKTEIKIAADGTVLKQSKCKEYKERKEHKKYKCSHHDDDND